MPLLFSVNLNIFSSNLIALSKDPLIVKEAESSFSFIIALGSSSFIFEDIKGLFLNFVFLPSFTAIKYSII